MLYTGLIMAPEGQSPTSSFVRHVVPLGEICARTSERPILAIRKTPALQPTHKKCVVVRNIEVAAVRTMIEPDA
jgi:hypothetical protein